jgi:hypothetical protein
MRREVIGPNMKMVFGPIKVSLAGVDGLITTSSSPPFRKRVRKKDRCKTLSIGRQAGRGVYSFGIQ